MRCRRALQGEAEALCALAKVDAEGLTFSAGACFAGKLPAQLPRPNGAAAEPQSDAIVLVVADGLQVSLPLAGGSRSAFEGSICMRWPGLLAGSTSGIPAWQMPQLATFQIRMDWCMHLQPLAGGGRLPCARSVFMRMPTSVSAASAGRVGRWHVQLARGLLSPWSARAHHHVTGHWQVRAGLFDPQKELARLSKQQEKLAGEIAAMDGRLANQSFVDKAPAKVRSCAAVPPS